MTCGISKGFLISVCLHYNLVSVKVLQNLKTNYEGFLLRNGNFMSVEKTLSIIKPDAVKKNVIGEIYTRFEKKGLKIVAAKMLSLTIEEAEEIGEAIKAALINQARLPDRDTFLKKDK